MAFKLIFQCSRYRIPAQSYVFGFTGAVHMDPEVWPDPHVVRPERHLDKDGLVVHDHEHIMPFSVGRLHRVR